MKAVLLVLLLGAAVFADNQWIGGKSATLGFATIRAVKTRPNSTTAYFRINESNGNIGDGRKWLFDPTTAQGKVIMANILTAISAGMPVTFHETTCSTSHGYECGIDEFILGNDLW